MNVKFSAKCVAVIAAGAMSMSLVACSGGSMDDSSNSNGSAANSDTITLGSITTNSGTAAAYGEAEVAGFKLAVDEINAKGGINGKKVKLESMDDKGDATEASNAFNKLAGDDSVLGVLGPTISSTTAAVAPLADQAKLPAIAPAATSDSIETGGYMFRTCFKDSYQGEIAAKFAADTLKVKKVAVLYGTGDPYSSGVGKAFAVVGGTGDEGVAARAGNLHCVIIRMDTLLHSLSPRDSGDPGRNAPMASREPDNLSDCIRSLDFTKKWGVTGLNRGPADYESDALTD